MRIVLFARALLALALAVGVSFVIEHPAAAQSTSSFQGTIFDPQGAPLADAKITIVNSGTGIESKATTDANGDFLFPTLTAGKYKVTVERDGFKSLVVSTFTIDVDTRASQVFTLSVGGVTETVEITEAAPAIESSTMTVGSVIDQKTVQEIPLNGRHFVDLGLLIPGTVTPPANGFLTAPLRGQGSFGLNTAGNREDTVNFMINGINLNDPSQNQITFQPSINTVSEFKASNSTFSAEYGHTSGTIANIATRSGSNELHGEVFDYFRNNALDARNFFNVAKSTAGSPLAQSPFKRNNFGAALGGPIKKDKAFFFASYEGLRQRQGLTLNATVPDATQRVGVTDPAVLALLATIPLPNVGSNFVGSASANVNIDQGTGDLSFNLSPNDNIHGYFALQQDARQEPNLQGNNIPGWGDIRTSRRQIGTFNYNHTFSPTLVNEARVGYNRIHIIFNPIQPLNPQDFDINNGITTTLALPQISVASGFNIGGPSTFPQGRSDTTVAFSDTLTWIHGKHTVAFGTEVRREYNNNLALNGGTFTFSSLSNFLADSASQYTVLLGNGNDKLLAPSYALFVQDNFKMKPYFMLELGLRYEANLTPSEAAGKLAVFDPATASLVLVGTTGIDRLYDQNNKLFEPRIGFAWDPFHKGKTSVRAGYGIYYDQPVMNTVSGLSSNPPFAVPVSFAPSTGTTLSFLNAASFGASSVSPSSIDPDFKNDYVQNWNLNIQHEITPTTTVTVGYYGSKGTHLRISENLNQQGTLAAAPFSALSASSPILPGTKLGSSIPEITSGGNSTYHALWVTARKRFARGLQFDAYYAYSHSIDYNSLNSQGVVVQDSTDIQNDRGSSDYDVRHRATVSAFYQFPFKGNRFISGWQVGLIEQAQTGNPLNYLTANTSFTGNRTQRPNVNGHIEVVGDPSEWINYTPTNQVLVAPSGTFGNLGRNAITGPSFVNTDFSVMKDTKITERFKLQFRVEEFDLFNHPNFGNPNLILPTAQLGSFNQITSTRFPTGDFGSARQMQITLRLMF
jgi:Cna protein B-type domain.